MVFQNKLIMFIILYEHHFTTFEESCLSIGNNTIDLTNTGLSDLIDANFVIGYNI